MTENDAAAIPPFVRSQATEHSAAYMGSIVSFLAGARETGGNMSVLAFHAKAGSEPPPHLHDNENEMFLVTEGELEVHCEGEDEPLVAKPGNLVFVPRGKAHAFLYRTARARMIVLFQAPDGRCTSEFYFRDLASGPVTSMEIPSAATHHDMADAALVARVRRLCRDNGIYLLSQEEIARRLPGYQVARWRRLPASPGSEAPCDDIAHHAPPSQPFEGHDR